MQHDDQTTNRVLSDFFAKLRNNPLIKESVILALEDVAKADKLGDSTAIQTAIRKSLGNDDATA